MKGQGKKRAMTRARARFRSTAARFDVHKKKRERERERERESDLFFGSSSAADEKKKPSSRQEKPQSRLSPFFLSLFPSLSLFLRYVSLIVVTLRIARRRAFFLTQNTGVFGVVEEKTEEEEDAR